MSNKTVILTHCFKNTGWPTEITIGKWNDQQQKTFIDELARKIDDKCRCSFNVYNGTHNLSECGTPSFHENNFDNLKNINAEELVISIKPSLPVKEIFPWNGKCGAKSGEQCLKNIQTGKCKSLIIKALVGKALFPKEY